MKKGFLAATLVAFLFGLGGVFATSPVAFAAEEEKPSKCDKIEDEDKRDACLEKEAEGK